MFVGQAIVQMAMSKTTRLEYAIKFFLSAAGFNEERGLYRQGSGITGGNFAQFLPKVCCSPAFYCVQVRSPFWKLGA